MAQVDFTSFDAALKEYYTDEQVKDQSYEDNPWFAMCPKLESLTGDVYVQPVQYGKAYGSRSADISKALGNKDRNRYVKFVVDTVEDYVAISISRKVMKASANNRGAFFEARTREIDSMLDTLVRSIAGAMYGNGGGALGQVGSGQGTTTITLLEPEDIVNFEVGMRIVASDDDGSSSAHALHAGGPVTITAVDRDAGTITASAAWTGTIAALGANDYLFVDGDFKSKLHGLGGWIPTTAPTSGDSWFQVDRSVDVSRLAGSRISASSSSIREALRMGASRLGREMESPELSTMSHQKYRDLLIELDNKVEFSTTNVTANVGFTGVKIVGGKKPITVYPDHNCPDARTYLLTKDTWKLISYGPIPDLHDDDGVRMLRESSSDGFEVRASYYAEMVCSNPRANAVITLE